MDTLNGARQQRGHRQLANFVATPGIFPEGNRIRYNYFRNRRFLYTFHSGTREDRMRRASRNIFSAPASISASAPFTSVPAVSIRSSTIMQFRPRTSPMIFITSATFACSRRLSIMASGALRRLAKARARSTPPASGDTTVYSAGQQPTKMLDHHRGGKKMINRDIEESLNLGRMQIQTENPVRARPFQQAGNQLCRNRDARLVLSVLPGIPIIG